MNTQTEDIARVANSDSGVALRIEGLQKRFHRKGGGVVDAISNSSLEVADGEFVVLLGPSGCGKTTLLRSVAGLEHPDEGEIEVGGVRMFSGDQGIDVPPERRHIGMIFQSYALWPHMTAFQNIAYPIRSRHGNKVSKAELNDQVHSILETVGIPELAQQYPNQMSGGQQQRVALARALVGGERLVLFDEPLSNVDAKLRDQLRVELLSMQAKLGFAALFVTHDQEEAMLLADRIAVINQGRIEQLGTPKEIYQKPATRYVANFIGRANEILGTVKSVDEDERGTVIEFDTEIGTVTGYSDTPFNVGDAAAAVFRPELTETSLTEVSGRNVWKGSVRTSIYLGTHSRAIVDVGDRMIDIWRNESLLVDPGTDVWLSVNPHDVRIISQ